MNPFNRHYTCGISFDGMVPDRPEDTFCIGFFHDETSDDFPDVLGTTDRTGFEGYYKVQATPWMQITPDVQYLINPGIEDRDDTLVIGLRMLILL